MKIRLLASAIIGLLPGALIGANPDLNTILNGLRDAEAICQNVSLDIKYDSQLRTSSNDYVTTRTDATATFDNHGRARFESVGDIVRDTTPPKRSRMKVKATFDGQVCKVQEGAADPKAKASFARVTASTHQIPWMVDPRDLLTSLQGKSVSQWLAENGPVTITADVWRGRTVTLVETAEALDPEVKTWGKVSFWIDTKRGFAVVRKAFKWKPKNGREWTETLNAEGDGYWRHETGLWLPSTYTVQSYKFISKDHEVRDLYTRHHMMLSNWRLNLNLAAEYFSMKFPPGVLVTDELSAKTYKTGQLKDEDLTLQFAEAQAAADAVARSARFRYWLKVAVSCTLGLLNLGCILLIVRRWRALAVA